MFIAIGSSFGLAAIAPIFVPIFLGREFTDCIDVVVLLVITILFIAWANVIRTQYLIPKKMDKVYIVSTALGAVVNFGINIFLIGIYGAKGASIGTIFAEFSVGTEDTNSLKAHTVEGLGASVKKPETLREEVVPVESTGRVSVYVYFFQEIFTGFPLLSKVVAACSSEVIEGIL